MSPLGSTSRAIGTWLSRSNGKAMLTRHGRRISQVGNFEQYRCLSSIAGIETPCIEKLVDNDHGFGGFSGGKHEVMQVRQFLSCGDGVEGSALSKTYEERRVMGYSPDQLFAVVAAVDLYEDFVPWCQRSKVIRHNPDGSFDAELQIGFKFFVESYVSHVELNKPKSIKVIISPGYEHLSLDHMIKSANSNGAATDEVTFQSVFYLQTTASQSNLFDHLINIWEFNPGSVPGTTDLYFLVDFKFQSPLYRQVASMFFKEVVAQLVGSFSERCRLIYGPGLQVLENSFGEQRT